MARRYQKIKELVEIIKEKQREGKSQKEIEKELCLEGNRPIHELLKRERRKEKRELRNEKGRGRPRKREMTKEEELEKENRRLKMENELLINFLKETERR